MVMHDVIIIPIENIAGSFLDLIGFIWGWMVTGGLFKLAIKIGEFLAMYYAKKELEKEDPHRLITWARHFVENHDGHRPSVCDTCQK